MNKKQFVFYFGIIFTLIVLSSNVLAAYNATQETEQVNKAYTWLSDAVRGKWPAGTEDSAFSLMALAYDDSLASEGRTALLSKSRNSEGGCWPETSCNVKETALAVMALTRIGQDASKAEEWLMAMNSTPSELNWYMQIETSEKAVCTIYYDQDSLSYNITLATDKKINKAAGSCLSLSYGNYWLKVDKDCYEKKFTVSCDAAFITALFYQKPGSTTIYISSDTKSESAGGEATLGISSICLRKGDSCDYEGTAWAAVALSKNRDVSIFIPYLVGYADNNEKILPEAFLLMLTGQDDYANKLIGKFKREGYWTTEGTGIYSKEYYTALALLALKERAPKQKDIAKNWILNEQAKTGPDTGSWQSSKKDTGFILYSVWPKDATYVGVEQLYCKDYGYFCIPTYDCNFDSRITDYYCSGTDICCKEQEEKLATCSEMNGIICDFDKICSGTSSSALDGLCCLGECTEPETTSECEKEGYICRYTCEENEKQNNFECAGARSCCEPVAAKARGKLWLWLLLILIIAAAIASFLFRDKLKFKPKPKTQGMTLSPKPRFGFPPPPPTAPARALARPSLLRTGTQPREISSNKDLEETLRKLRERGG